MKKRLWLYVTTFVLLIFLFVFSAFVVSAGEEEPDFIAFGYCGADTTAEYDQKSGAYMNLTWTLYEDGKLVIDGKGPMKDYASKSSSPWTKSKYIDKIVTLQLNHGLTNIGDYTFYGCNKITGDLVIPDSVTRIGVCAFDSCSGLTGSLLIPDSVTRIDDSAFGGCTRFSGSLSIGKNVTSIGTGAFSNCGFTGNLVIPDSVTSIGESAFWACAGFKGSLSIGKSVTSIGESAFYKCTGFTGSLIIPDSVISMGSSAFDKCSGFNGSIVIGKNVSSIEDYTFRNCSGLTGSLVIPDSVSYIGRDAFRDCVGFTGNLTIGDSVTGIDIYAFDGCNGFTGNLHIGKNVMFIAQEAFRGCSGFSGNLVIPDSVTSIGGSAFAGCSGFNGRLIFGKSVTSIGKGAFSKCSGFTGDLIIPDSVTSIGEQAFNDCTGFSGELVLSKRLTTIESSSFLNCKGLTGDLVIPDSVTIIRSNAFQYCEGLTGTLVIPDNVKRIETAAFYHCYGFTGLDLGDSLEYIGGSAFCGCKGIKGKLVLPNSLIQISSSSFNYCTGLSGNLIIPANVTHIYQYAFSECNNLTGVYFKGDAPTVIYGKGPMTQSFPDSVTLYYTPGTAGWTDSSNYDPAKSTWARYPLKEWKNDFVKSADYTLYVVDGSTGLPVDDFTVEIGSRSYEEENGAVAFTASTGSVLSLTVKADGYFTYTDKNYTVSSLRQDTLLLYSENVTEGIKAAKCNDSNILTKKGQINVKADLYATIELEGVSQNTITEYSIVQNGNIIATSTDGKFKIKNSNFTENVPVYAVMTTSVACYNIKLNIDVVSFGYNNNILRELLSKVVKDIGIELPRNTPLIGELKIDLYKSPTSWKQGGSSVGGDFKYYIDNYGQKVGFGFNAAKDLTKLNGGLKKYNLEHNRKVRNNDVNGGLMAYITCEYDKNGMASVKGELFLSVSFKHTWKKNMIVPVGPFTIPVYVEFSIGAGGELSIENIKYDIRREQWSLLEQNLSLSVPVSAKAGLGCSFASVGIYGGITGKATVGVLPEFKLKMFDLSGELGGYFQIGIIEEKIPFVSGSIYKYPSKMMLLSPQYDSIEQIRDSMYDISEYEPMNRDYLSRRLLYSGVSPVLTGYTKYIQYHSSSLIKPKIVTCGEDIMMLYIDDDGTEGSNYSHIYYSLYNKTSDTWSAAKKMFDSRPRDDDFDVCTDGEKIYVVFTESKSEYKGSLDDYKEMLSDIAVFATEYDKANDRFTDPVMLSDNSSYNFIPRVYAENGTVYAVWANNTENDIFGQNKKNNIFVSTKTDGAWSKAIAICENTETVTEMSIGNLGGEVYISAVKDEDCNLATEDDRLLYVISSDGDVSEIETENDANGRMIFSDGRLVWFDDGTLLTVKSLDDETETFFGDGEIIVTNDFDIITIGKNIAVVYTDSDGDEGTNLYAVFDNGENYGFPVKLTDCGEKKYVSAYAAENVNGSLLVAFRETSATVTNDDIIIDNNFAYVRKDSECDIAVGNVYCDYDELVEFVDVSFEVDVTNKSWNTVDKVRLSIADGESEIITDTIECNIASGETKTVTLNVLSTELIGVDSCTVTATAVNETDVDMTDNTFVITTGYSDFSVEAIQRFLPLSTDVVFAVTNNGNKSGNGILTVKNGDDTIYEKTLSDFGLGDTLSDIIPITDGMFSDGNDIRLSFEVVPSVEEPDFDNNTLVLNVSKNEKQQIEEVDLSEYKTAPEISENSFNFDKENREDIVIELTENDYTLSSVDGINEDGFDYSGGNLTIYSDKLSGNENGIIIVSLTFTCEEKTITKEIEIIVTGENAAVTVSGVVTSFNPSNAVTVELRQNDAVKYSATIEATSGNGQITQQFSLSDVIGGTYDLVVTKAGHLDYTVTGIVVTDCNIDLTKSEKTYAEIKLIAGDVDGDGLVNGKDVQAIRLVGNINHNVSDAANALADVDGDGLINGKDVQTIRLVTNINKGTRDTTFAYEE